MKPREFSDILKKYIDGVCTDEERILVEKWCDFIAEKERKTIDYPYASKAKIYERIARANSESRHKPVGRVRFFTTLEAAAALVMAILYTTLFTENFSRQNSASANRAHIQPLHSDVINNSALPMKVHFEDGTEVVLDTKSKLSAMNFSAHDRKLTLEGKAFFNVARNPKRPFYIYTSHVTTKVLGTSFTIDARDSEGETVEVKTGKVAVYKTEKEAKSQHSLVIITPNLKVHYNKSTQALIPSIVEHPMIIPKIEPSALSSAKTSVPPTSRKMEFVGARIVDVFKALETAYGIKIKCDAKALGNCVMTIKLVDEDLYTRLHAVCAAIGASYTVDGTEIVIENGAC